MKAKILLATLATLAWTVLAQTVDTVIRSGLEEPYSVVVDRSTTNNWYYLTDAVNMRVVRYSPADGEVTDLTGAALFNPHGIVLTSGHLVVAESGGHRVFQVDPVTGGLTLLAGSTQGYTEGAGATAQFSSPSGLAVDAAGNIFVADAGNGAVRKITPAGVVSTYATGFNWPTGVALGEGGRLFVADTLNNAIRLVETDGTVKTIAAALNRPRGILWVGGATGLLVSDTGSHAIRRVSNPSPALTNIWNTVLYAGSSGISGVADGPLTTARFFEPVGLTIDLEGAILVADLKNNALRRIQRPATKTPALTPAGGSFSNTVSVTVASLTTNAAFYYTTDGSDPTPSSLAFPSALVLTGGPVGLKVRAFSPDLGSSLVISNNFSFFVNPLDISVPGGNFTNDVNLKITSLTAGATVRYSTTANAPTTASPAWVDGLYGRSGVLRVKAFRDGFTDAPQRDLDFSFTCTTPAAYPPGPAGGVAPTNNPIDLLFYCGTAGATLRWTLAPDEPSETFGTIYTGPFKLATNGLLRIQAFKDGYAASSQYSATYTLQVSAPVQTPTGGVATNNAVQVSFTDATQEAQVYWTIDGTEPTSSSTLYTAPFVLGTNGTLKARGIRKGFLDSDIVSSRFDLKVSTPAITPAGATNNNAVTVTLVSATPDSQIYWTIDGSEPTVLSTLYAGPFALGTNGTLKAKAFRNGFVASETTEADFNLEVSTPTISPNGLSTNNVVTVTLASTTTGAQLYWTIDGAEPTTASTLYAAPFALGTNGTLKVKALRDGFVASGVASAEFKLQVATPVIAPNGLSTNNAVDIAIASATADAEIRWTINGTDPTRSSTLYAAPFALGTNGVLKAKAFRNGFVDSDLQSATFDLTVATPTVTPASGTTINTVTIAMSSATTGAELRYTLDGADPVSTSLLYAAPFALTTNATLKVTAFRPGFVTSASVSREYGIQVDTPILTPSTGFFPDGTTIGLSWTRPDASAYYTLDGSDPSTNSLLYTAPFKLNALVAPGADLRAVKARAFAPGTIPSALVSGQPVAASAIGVPRDVVAGVGATIVLPVVVNLKAGEVLRSVQFKVLAFPSNGGPPLTTDLRPLSTGANDFVVVAGSSEGTSPTVYNATTYTITGAGGVFTNVVELSALGTNANFVIRSFGTVAELAITVPAAAAVGHEYTVQIANPSGTSDGVQQAVALTALSAKIIRVSNVSYVVGDSSPGNWYNAGDFGNGELDNADVNNAFYASMGVRVPFSFTDAFDAMDAFPEDTLSSLGGDGQIRFLDWQRVLRRALRRDLTNWKRSWSAAGVRVPSTTTLAGSPTVPVPVTTSSLEVEASAWPDGEVIAGHAGQLRPGDTASIPVRVRTRLARGLVGVQFRLQVRPGNGAPALEAPVEWVSAPEMPQPVQMSGLAADEVGVAWSPLLNPFAQSLSQNTELGAVRFAIPASALPRQTYTVVVSYADGSPDLDTQYDLVGRIGSVTVGAPAQPSLAGDAASGVRMRWQAASGQRFAVESTSDLVRGPWRVEADNLVGRGSVQEFLDRSAASSVRFYRIVTRR